MRPASQEMLGAVRASLDRFGPSVFDEMLRDHDAELWIREGEIPSLHLVGKRLTEALRASGSIQATSAGLRLADLYGAQVRWSLEGVYEIGRRSNKGQIRVTEKGAQLFLYGKEILGESVDSHDPELREGSVALVANRRGDVLGLGRIVKRLPGRGRVLEPMLDRGWYLREGG